MHPHLNGIQRNHYEGYINPSISSSPTSPIFENRYNEKVDLYNGIANNFSGGGRSIYRIGHNVSDGNFDFSKWDTKRQHPGWHWATSYGNGFNEDYIAASFASYTVNSVNPTTHFQPNPMSSFTTTTRIGAGTRHYCYRNTEEIDNGATYYSGFAVTVNYINGIKLDFARLPRSVSVLTDQSSDLYTIPTGTGVGNYCDDVTNAIVSQGNHSVVQVGGPLSGEVLPTGNYEMNYRITNASGEVAYWGVILSVNHHNAAVSIVRTHQDELIDLDPNIPAGGSALVRHSFIHTVNNYRIATGGNWNADDYYLPNNPNLQLPTGLPFIDVPYGYDDLDYILDDVSRYNVSGLAVCLNIMTGYPEEAVGLIEYLAELGQNVAFVELGSELMGYWNKGFYQLGNTPQNLAASTVPFARAIKYSSNDRVSDTKIATTSTYGYTIDFDSRVRSSGCNVQNPLTNPPISIGSIEKRVQDWLAPFSGTGPNGKHLIDYLNIHDYPDYQSKGKPDPNDPKVSIPHTPQDKYRKTGAAHQYFEEEVLPAIWRGIDMAGLSKHLEIVVTEGGTGTEFHKEERMHSSITEAFYYTESFMVAARNAFKAHIHFAQLKDHALFANLSLGNCLNDPTDETNVVGNDTHFNVHFYTNNGGGMSQNGIYVKPVFKAKKMIFENLGEKMILPANVIMSNVNAGSGNSFTTEVNGVSVNTPIFSLLATVNTDDNHAYILITNRNPNAGVSELNLFLDNIRVMVPNQGSGLPAPQLMYLVGDKPFDIRPEYTLSNGLSAFSCPNSLDFNNKMPEFQDIVFTANGNIQIPNLSICILKVALDNVTLVACASDPTATGKSCDAIEVEWIQPAAGTNNTLLTQSIYYYEQLDGTGTAPTVYDATDPNWKHYTDVDVACTKTTIVGLPFPQDEYQIAVVFSYGVINSNTFVGPGKQTVACFTTASTTYCEDHIDRSYINTETLTNDQGVTINNPNQACLDQLFDYSDIPFCIGQLALTAPSVGPNTVIVEVELNNAMQTKAIRLLGGAVEGTVLVYYDDDLATPGYTNQSTPYSVTLKTDEWLILPLSCDGIADIKRIQIKQPHGGEMVRKIVLDGEPINPSANEPMPKCCAAKDAVVLELSPNKRTLSSFTMLLNSASPDQEILIKSHPNWVNYGISLSFDIDYTFDNKRMFFDNGIGITLKSGVTANFTNSLLKGCDFMWGGISTISDPVETDPITLNFKNSEIQDAVFAIIANSQSNNNNLQEPTINITDSRFYRNANAITIGRTLTYSQSYINEFKNIDIDGTNSYLKPLVSSPLIKRRAQAGIYIVESNNDLWFSNTNIRNVVKPIVANFSNLVAFSGGKIDNTNYILPPTNQLGANRIAVSAGRNSLLVCTSMDIKGFELGIVSYKQGTEYVAGCSTDKVKYGYYGQENRNSSVFANNFVFDYSGITLNDYGVTTQSNRIDINNNRLSHNLFAHNSTSLFGNTYYGGVGIGLSDYITSATSASARGIQSNTILVKPLLSPNQTVAAGILLNNTRDVTVRNNDIGLQNNLGILDMPRFYGIFKQSGSANIVCANTITGLRGFDRGIGSYMSPGTIQCNDISLTKHALYFVGGNQAMNAISGNLIQNSAVGLYVNNDAGTMQAILGDQEHQANKWKNNWLNGAFWNGSQAGISQSEFRVNSILSAEYWPFPQVNSSSWFEDQQAPLAYTACPDIVGKKATTCESPIVEPCYGEGCFGDQARNANRLQEPYRSMVERRAYAQVLETYPMGNYPEEIQAYMERYVRQSFSYLVDLERFIANPLAEHPNLKASKENLEQDLDALRFELDAHFHHLASLSGAALDDYLASGQASAVVQEAMQIGAALKPLQAEAESIEKTRLEEAYTINQNLPLEDEFSELERTVNEIYLRHRLSDELFLSVADMERVEDIATRCPQDWGEAVYKARALWLQNGGGVDVRWEKCSPTEEQNEGKKGRFVQGDLKKEELELPMDKAIAYPVPVENVFVLSVPESYIGGKYEIINTVGTSLKVGDIEYLQTSIDASLYSNGMHFIRITKDNLRPMTLSIVVQKL